MNNQPLKEVPEHIRTAFMSEWPRGDYEYYMRNSLLAALNADRAYIAPPAEPEKADKDDSEKLQLIDERDEAEQAMSQAYYLVTGRSPEWSNNFGYEQALEDIKDSVNLFKDAARPAEPAATPAPSKDCKCKKCGHTRGQHCNSGNEIECLVESCPCYNFEPETPTPVISKSETTPVASASDMCVCGDQRKDHECGLTFVGRCKKCNCPEFRPVQPSPPPVASIESMRFQAALSCAERAKSEPSYEKSIYWFSESIEKLIAELRKSAVAEGKGK